MDGITWHWLPFDELTTRQLHDLLALRVAVFVVEQNCPYQEVDGKDLLAFHLFATDAHDKIVACSRVLPAGTYFEETSIGRVVTDESVRGTGVGHEMLQVTLGYIEREIGKVPIRISAQKHLTHYYGRGGFEVCSEPYLEDGIPHVAMLRPASAFD